MDEKTWKELDNQLTEHERIGQVAVKKAQEALRKKGLPIVYCDDRKMYFEMPDGTVLTRDDYYRRYKKSEPPVTAGA
ncbi:MAG: hypothetical protein HQL05_04300 [Nitrospirae bacterium]|uniref:hypothetical protein n=1 Tax=Candidatus Magnetobacterium casense TaxID=1455061 RepID=UPI00058FA1E5|nr:hypothetical protein [Candidatus Magnetobacterium casensis]MBF0337032.1 hypothetical protein [Nitrospirota bacterium]